MIKMSVIVLIGIALIFTVARCSENKPDKETLQPLSDDDKKSIIQNTCDRVAWIRERVNNNWYDDCYDGNILIYRCVIRGVGIDDAADLYDMYYDKYGKLIFVEVRHYRDVHYYICFHDDKLLHAGAGDFLEFNELLVNGDFPYTPFTIKEDERYAVFILEDIEFCLGI